MRVAADLYKKISVNYEIRSDLPRIFVGFRQKLRRSLQAVNDGAIFYESTEKTGQSAVCIQKILPYNSFLLVKYAIIAESGFLRICFFVGLRLFFNLFFGR